MPFAISIKATNETAVPVHDLWEQVSAFEELPSMIALDYPPHITFAIYDEIDTDKLERTLRKVFRDQCGLRLAFDRICYFEHPLLVLWAAPADISTLLPLHKAIHDHIDASLCRSHYRPGVWIPHCTLATQIRADQRTDALSFTNKPIEPFEVLFDTADCIAFKLIQVINECTLG